MEPTPETYTLTPGIVAAAAFVFVVGYWIARRHLSRATSISIAFIKAAIPFVFFLRFYDGRWHFLDDFVYEEEGRELLAAGFTPFSAVATSSGRNLLFTLAEGPHALYGWWNLLAQWAFGQAYWAPIFLNVLMTFVGGYSTARMLEDIGFPRRYIRGFLVLFLLHIEVLVWSSFVNLKDILILAMAAIALRSIVALARLYKERRSRPRRLYRRASGHVIVFVIITILFAYIRFYVPLLLLGAVAVWSVLSLPIGWRIAVILTAPLAALWFVRTSQHAIHLHLVELFSVPWGLVRFPLTPRPWATEANYSFLIIPAIVNWMLFIPALMAGAALWFARPLARLPLIYLAIVVTVFAAIPWIQGPRHRVQALPLIIWLQFHAIWWFAAMVARRAPTNRRRMGEQLPSLRQA